MLNERVRDYIEDGNYLQIYYDDGLDFVENLLEYFEQEENYEKCTEIRKCLEGIEKVSGRKILK